jgi:hypothetical protein
MQAQIEGGCTDAALLLHLVDTDESSCASLPPSSLKSLAAAVTRASGATSGVLLCALVTAAAARLGVQGAGAIAAEESKELCTLVLHRCASAAVAAARAAAGG